MMQRTQGSSEEQAATALQPGHNMLSVMQAQAINSPDGVDGACEWGGGLEVGGQWTLDSPQREKINKKKK